MYRNRICPAGLPAKTGGTILQMSMTIYGDLFHDSINFSSVPLLYYG